MAWFSWLVFAFEGAVAFLLAPSDNCGELSVTVIVIGAVTLLLEMMLMERDDEVRVVLAAGLLFRVALLVWDLEFSDGWLLPGSGADSEMYARAAVEGYVSGDYSRGGAYARLIGFVYSFFGVQRPIAQFVNLLLGMSMITLVLRTTDYLVMGTEAKRSAAKLLCFLPNFAIMNVVLLRETPIAFLLTVSVALCLRWCVNGNWTWFACSVLTVMFAATMHSGALAVALGEAVFAVLYDRDAETLTFEPGTVARALVVGVITIALFSYFGDSIRGKLNTTEVGVVVERTETVYGGSGYTVGIHTDNSTLDFVVNTPLRMLYFVASPMPWRWRGLTDVIAFFFSALFYIVTYWLALDVLRQSKKPRHYGPIVFLLLLALSSAFMFGWGVENAGTALRHREKFTAIYVLLYCLCKESRLPRGTKHVVAKDGFLTLTARARLSHEGR